MATNNFKSFATATGANVTSQSEYETLPALASGFSSGKASSAQINKALRQSSTMAAMLGQTISNANLDALDNGNITSLAANFLAAMKTNLSLGSASSRNIGIGDDDIPDMSKFTRSLNNNGYQKLPGGLIIQWGTLSDDSTYIFNFPMAYPSAALGVYASADTGVGGDISLTSMTNVHIISKAQASIIVVRSYSGVHQLQTRRVHWFSVGY